MKRASSSIRDRIDTEDKDEEEIPKVEDEAASPSKRHRSIKIKRNSKFGNCIMNLVGSLWYSGGVCALCIINLVIIPLALDSRNNSEAILIVEQVITLFYLVDIFFQLYYRGVKGYFKGPFTYRIELVNQVMNILSIIEFYSGEHDIALKLSLTIILLRTLRITVFLAELEFW